MSLAKTKAQEMSLAEAAQKEAPQFRRIERQWGTGEWIGYTGDAYCAKFLFEADAVAWRWADPLNKGTLDELLEREKQRAEKVDSIVVRNLREAIRDLEERAPESPRRNYMVEAVKELKKVLADYLEV